jgi:hypothetical protein
MPLVERMSSMDAHSRSMDGLKRVRKRGVEGVISSSKGVPLLNKK